MPRLQGRIVLVTGASRGIGLAIARACADEGAKLILVARHSPPLVRAAKQVAGDPLALVADITRPADVARVFRAVRRRYARLDALVASAGVFTFKAFTRTTLAEWRRNIETNLTSLFLTTQAALPLLAKSRSGHIVNILSISSRVAFPNCSAYAASKFGALGFTKVMAKELRSKKIRVTAILPGSTDTRMMEEFDFPIDRSALVQPEDVAAAVVCALVQPPRTTVEEVVIMPSRGSL
ncbi:MAG TPA: SDR family oxidoreductase [Terriglobia bacterium]|nr:SDR family oxidoreductase [Terriglobia bacterium]